MDTRVRYEVAGGVADVRLSRPEKLNAFDTAMMEGLIETIDALGRRNDVRCVVLSGEGRAFCAGVDLDGLGKREPGSLLPRWAGPANKPQQAAYGWRALPQPVIAAVHGYAFGAGFQIMLGADMRIAAPGAQLSIMEARWGLVPDVAGVALLRGLLRDDVVRELTYTARRFDAAEALRLGVVTRLADDPHAEAMALARAIAANSPEAIRAAKRLLNLMADAQAAEILLAESVEQTRLLASEGHRETVAAAKARRAPIFPDPA
jgi:enoyl-CoA hydratase/carnithine racemase